MSARKYKVVSAFLSICKRSHFVFSFLFCSLLFLASYFAHQCALTSDLKYSFEFGQNKGKFQEFTSWFFMCKTLRKLWWVITVQCISFYTECNFGTFNFYKSDMLFSYIFGWFCCRRSKMNNNTKENKSILKLRLKVGFSPSAVFQNFIVWLGTFKRQIILTLIWISGYLTI